MESDAMFIEMCAAAADRGVDDIDTEVDRLLDGAPLSARWADVSTLIDRLLHHIAPDRAADRMVVAERLVEAVDGLGEGHLRTVAAALAAADGRLGDRDESVVHALRGCELVIRWSNVVARAERVHGGDPIRWCSGRNVPAHWRR